MSYATDLVAECGDDQGELFRRAYELDADIFQDWENESTTIGFADGSWIDVWGEDVDASGPHLIDYATGDAIREATEQEFHESEDAARHDGGAGVIDVDGRACFVNTLLAEARIRKGGEQ